MHAPSLRDSAPTRFALGAWIVEPSAGRLRRGDGSVHVEPKVMDLLLALAATSGEVVTRDRLFDLVWPDVIVSDSALNRSVSDLRRVLGDDPRRPTYIETIAKVGYRLLPPAEPLPEISGDGADDLVLTVPPATVPAVSGDGTASEAPLPLAPEAAPLSRWGGLLLGAAVLACVAAAAALWTRADRAPTFPEVVAEGQTRILPTLPGAKGEARLSPDGTRIAFVADGADSTGAQALYVQSLGGSTPVKVADRAMGPAWSPDGILLAFQRPPADAAPGSFTSTIHTVTEYGTDERLVLDEGVLWGGVSWSPDGGSIVYVGLEESGDASGLHLLDLESGSRRPLTSTPLGQGYDFLPRFSPNGERVAFARYLNAVTTHLYVVSVSGGEAVPVTDDDATLGGLAWTPGGEGLVFSSNRTGMYQLWSVVPGAAPTRLAVPAVDPSDPSVVDGALAVADWRFDIGVWVGTAASAPEVVWRSTARDTEPALSPTGDRLAFVSTRSGSPELWVGRLGDDAPRRLTEFGGRAIRAPRWSPDGQTLAFQAWADDGYDVYAVPAAGGLPEAVAAAPGDDVNPRWSRDGRALYVGSERSGEWNVWRVSLDGSHAEAVTTGGAFVAEEAPGGEGLYVMRPREDGLYHVLPGTDRAPRRVADVAAADGGSWAVTEAGLVTIDRSSGRPRLVVHAPDGSTRPLSEPLVQMPRSASAASVSRDGRAFAWSRIHESDNDIILVETERREPSRGR